MMVRSLALSALVAMALVARSEAFGPGGDVQWSVVPGADSCHSKHGGALPGHYDETTTKVQREDSRDWSRAQRGRAILPLPFSPTPLLMARSRGRARSVLAHATERQAKHEARVTPRCHCATDARNAQSSLLPPSLLPSPSLLPPPRRPSPARRSHSRAPRTCDMCLVCPCLSARRVLPAARLRQRRTQSTTSPSSPTT